MSELSDALLTTLRELTGEPALVYDRTPEPLAGGYSAELLRFSIIGGPEIMRGELVARILVDDGGAACECAIQTAVERAGFPAPRIRFAANSSSPLGRPVIVMDHVEGKTPLATAGVVGLPRLFRELPSLLAGLMADLHAVAPPALEVPWLDVDAMLAVVQHATAGAWLSARRLAFATDVICHGDLHGENVLVAGGTVVAVVDWELASIGPPELDVARTALLLGLLPGVSGFARKVLGRSAAKTERAFVDAYAARRPLDRDALRWCDALHCARLLAVAQRTGPVAEVWRPLAPALTSRLVRVTAGE
ncbi:MAG: phosphotransferase [Actinomycetota bacterium]|nr:phosphotransferase [Actinomycetota bacterium]